MRSQIILQATSRFFKCSIRIRRSSSNDWEPIDIIRRWRGSQRWVQDESMRWRRVQDWYWDGRRLEVGLSGRGLEVVSFTLELGFVGVVELLIALVLDVVLREGDGDEDGRRRWWRMEPRR
jgi:hypothetical protein